MKAGTHRGSGGAPVHGDAAARGSHEHSGDGHGHEEARARSLEEEVVSKKPRTGPGACDCLGKAKKELWAHTIVPKKLKIGSVEEVCLEKI